MYVLDRNQRLVKFRFYFSKMSTGKIDSFVSKIGNSIENSNAGQFLIRHYREHETLINSFLFMMVIVTTVLVVIIMSVVSSLENQWNSLQWKLDYLLQKPNNGQPVTIVQPTPQPEIINELPPQIDVMDGVVPVADLAPATITVSEPGPVTESYRSRYPSGAQPGSILLGDINPTVNVGDREFENPTYWSVNQLWNKSDRTNGLGVTPWDSREISFD